MTSPPSGTVTFLFTDIEGSTRRWEQQPEAMKVALARHDAMVREQIEAHGGHVFQTIGDAFCAAFANAHDALMVAVETQRALSREAWPTEVGEIRVRIALHSGTAEVQANDYFAPHTLNRLSRILSATHGGQTIISSVTYQLVCDYLPADVQLRDMGERRLRDLSRAERLYQLVTPDLPAEFPPLRTLDTRPNNLPAQTTSFVGREAEVAAVRAMLRQPHVRLVTLTGPGGTGKTRLSLQVAADLIDDFEQVCFVPLAAITVPGLVIPSIAQSLGLSESSEQSLAEALTEYLKERKLLLVLDNFEQVIEAAPQISEMLAATGLKVLVSSRIALHVYGGHEYAVPPLPLPNIKRLPDLASLSQYAAVSLFVQRAQAVKPDFAITNQNAAAVAEICVWLDGLPLAIELAAARVKLLTPTQMLTRLQSRLQLLTGGARDLPARQQTLRGAIDWSYNLLDRDEQALFQQLSVFVGGFSLAAAEAVCAPLASADHQLPASTLDGLASLVDKSLLPQSEAEADEPRFAMLETIREYAREQLAAGQEEAQAQQRHAAYYRALAEQAEGELIGPQQAMWLSRLEQEHDNLRSALSWLLKQEDSGAVLALCGGMWRFWYSRGYLSEGRGWLEAALNASAGQSSVARAKIYNAAGNLAYVQVDYEAARHLYTEALTIRQSLDDPRGVAISLSNLGLVATSQGEYETAQSLYEQSLSIRRGLQDRRGIAQSLNNLGMLATERGNYAVAERVLTECLSIQQQLGDSQGIANALHNLAEVAYNQGDYPTAQQRCVASLDLMRQMGNKHGIVYSLLVLSSMAIAEQQYVAAAPMLREGLMLAQELEERRAIAHLLVLSAQLMSAVYQRDEIAARLLGKSAAIWEAIKAEVSLHYRGEYQRVSDQIRSQLGEQRFANAYAEGKQMALEQAVGYVLERSEL